MPDQRYALVKSWLQALGYGTAQQVYDALDQPHPYSLREVENTLDELVATEPEEFEKVDVVYRSRKHYRSTGR